MVWPIQSYRVLSKTVAATGSAHIEFKKGAVAKVDLAGRIGTLHWLVTPKIAPLFKQFEGQFLPKTCGSKNFLLARHSSRSPTASAFHHERNATMRP